jgi:hypothetical protein
MRKAVDYSKELGRKLAEGGTLDEALTDLRRAGASICDCIVSVSAFRLCDFAEATQIVETSSAWSDYKNMTNEVLRIWRDSDGETEA